MIPYNEHARHHHHHNNHHHHHRSLVVSPDRRTRMSQPTLNSSFFGINFAGGIKGNTKLSYSSLRTSGDTSINSHIQQERLSTPNVHAFGNNIQDNNNAQLIGGEYRRGSMFSQPDICRISRPTHHTGTRERLSQPTLVTGDYYPQKMQHQRLSQPCLLSTWNEKPISLHSPIKQKRFNPAMVKISQRDRMSQLDFGGVAKFRYNRQLELPTKFNRDRFSIPELETQNDLRLIAGTPKQRYSLDSQLNPEGNRMRKLLPIASSPISEHQTGGLTKDDGNKAVTLLIPSERLENIIVATATPIIQSAERQLLAPILKTTPPTLPLSVRERMSVPEIRNASLRRLLDPPLRQRHSITGNLRQCLIGQGKEGMWAPNITEKKSPETSEDLMRKISKIELEKTEEQPEIQINTEPKHIQRHYSYTYDGKDEANEVIGKLGIALPKKKYLESNFDENEQVITTVIETEVPIILGSPKYNKKTHVYASETPKWMKKCLENDSLVKKTVHDSQVLKINQMNLVKMNAGKKSPEKNKNADKKMSPKKIINDNSSSKSPDVPQNIITMSANVNDECKGKNTCVRIKTSATTGENKYEVTIDSNWSETDLCTLGGLDCDTESEDSTSV